MQLTALTQLCHRFANAESLESIFHAAAEALANGTGITRVAVLALEADGTMQFRAARGLSEEYQRAVAGHSPWQVGERAPRAMPVDDVEREPAVAAFRAAFAREGIGALMFLPMVARGELTGKFMLYADQPTRWADKDLGYASAIADLLGAVLLRERELLRWGQARATEHIGLLASGIAHDFANVLTSISGYAELACQEVPPASRAREFLDSLVHTVQQGVHLTQRLLPLGHVCRDQADPVDVVAILGESLDMLRGLAGRNVTIELKCELERAIVRATRGGLQRVLLNLVANARDAMPGGGTIHVTVRRGRALSRTRHIEIVVQDHGIGMDHSTRQRLFQPLFTTKGGRGSGLGLATCYGIVMRLGGDIVVRSEPQRGSTFIVQLPEEVCGT